MVRRPRCIDNDLARRHLHAVVVYPRLVPIGEEYDRSPLLTDREMKDTRENFVAPLHPEPMQVDLRQVGAEVTLCCDKNLHFRGADRRLVGIRIGKGKIVARKHAVTEGVPRITQSY